MRSVLRSLAALSLVFALAPRALGQVAKIEGISEQQITTDHGGAPVRVTSITDGFVLTYDGTSKTWVAKAGGGGGPSGPAGGDLGGTYPNPTVLSLADVTGGSSHVLDLIGSTRGSVLYRGAASWSALTPGTAGAALVSNGAGADPTFSGSSLRQVLWIDGGASPGGNGSYLLPYNTIQAALNAVPIANNAATIRARYVLIIAPGSYDEDLTVPANTNVSLLGLGPWNLGLFNGAGDTVSSTRNITKTYGAALIDGVNEGFNLGTYIQFGDGAGATFAQQHSPRISGKITINGGGAGVASNLSIQAQVFGTGGAASLDATGFTGTLNFWTTNSTYTGTVAGVTTNPGLAFNTVDRCHFTALVTARSYQAINDCTFQAGMTTAASPSLATTGSFPFGFRNCTFNGTFTGPGNLYLDAYTNASFIRNAALLAGSAVKILTGEATRTRTISTSGSLTADDLDGTLLVDATAGPVTVTLPTATNTNDQRYTVKKTDASANAVTIATTGGQLIDGASTYALGARYDFVTVVANGGAWSGVAQATTLQQAYNAGGGGIALTSALGGIAITNPSGANQAAMTVTQNDPTSGAAAVFSGTISVLGTGTTRSQRFGPGTVNASNNSLVIGADAQLSAGNDETILISSEGTNISGTPGTCDKAIIINSGALIGGSFCHESVCIGWLALPTAQFTVNIGANTYPHGDWNVLLGAGAGDGGFSNVVSIGAHTQATAANEFVVGGENGTDGEAIGRYIDHMIFNGKIINPPGAVLVRASDSATNTRPGDALVLTGGLPNRNADSAGVVAVQYCPAGSSSVAALTTSVVFDTTGASVFYGEIRSPVNADLIIDPTTNSKSVIFEFGGVERARINQFGVFANSAGIISPDPSAQRPVMVGGFGSPSAGFFTGSLQSIGVASNGNIRFSSTTDGEGSADVFISRAGVGVFQIGATANSADGTAEARTLTLTGSGSGSTSFIAGASPTTTTYTLPPADGTSGQVLTTDGLHALTWTTVSGSSGDLSTVLGVGNSSGPHDIVMMGGHQISWDATAGGSFITGGTGGSLVIQAGSGGPGVAGRSAIFAAGDGDGSSSKESFLTLLGIAATGQASGWTLDGGLGTIGTDLDGGPEVINLSTGTGAGTPGTLAFVTSGKRASGVTTQTRVTVATLQGNYNNLSGTDAVWTMNPVFADGAVTSAGSHQPFYLNPTYNYTAAPGSRTASNTDIQVDRVETSLGTGTQNFMLLRAGTSGNTTRVQINNAGQLYATDSTALPAATTLGNSAWLVAYDAASPFRFLSSGTTDGVPQPAIFTLSSSRGTIQSPTASHAGDVIAQWDSQPYIGPITTYGSDARVQFAVDGAVTDGSSNPGRLVFQTCPSGSLTPASRWVIDNAGALKGTNALPIGWVASLTDPTGTPDTRMSRSSAGVVSLDTTTTADHAGSLQQAGATGAGTVAPTWTNFPGVNTGAQNPYTWFKMIAADGTTVYVAAFK